MSLIVVILLALLMIGVLPAWPYATGWGYWPSGAFGAALVVLLVVWLLIGRR